MFSSLLIDDPGAPGVGVAFTDRHGGFSSAPFTSLNLGRSDVDDPSAVADNFAALRRRLALGPIVTTHQVHGAEVLRVDDTFLEDWDDSSSLGADAGRTPLRRADAMVTTLRQDPAVALCIRVADCVPVLLADAATGVVAAAHAGREGFVGGVLPAVVAAMRDEGARHITAWIGPHICGGCYEVPAEMREAVGKEHPATRATTTWGTPALDLGAGCHEQLAGLDVDVVRLDPCTREGASLYSHRRDGAAAGRLAGIIWLLPGRDAGSAT